MKKFFTGTKLYEIFNNSNEKKVFPLKSFNLESF